MQLLERSGEVEVGLLLDAVGSLAAAATASDFDGLPEYCLRARESYASTSASSHFEAHSSVSSSTPEESILHTSSSLSTPSVESTAASQFHTSVESSVFGGGSVDQTAGDLSDVKSNIDSYNGTRAAPRKSKIYNPMTSKRKMCNIL